MPADPPKHTIRRTNDLRRLEVAANAEAVRLLGMEPRVQIIIVDLIACDPLLYTPLPIRIPVRPRRLNRDRLIIARGNLDMALADFQAASDRWLAVEDADRAEHDRESILR